MASLWEETTKEIVKSLGMFPYLQWVFSVLLSGSSSHSNSKW